MKLNKEKFLKSELGGNLQECVTAWDHWLTELRKFNIDTVGQKYRETRKAADWCQAQWEVFQTVMRQFYNIEYHFSRSLGNGTGRAEKTTTYEGGVAKEYTVDGKTSVCWRGKENFWGNIWKFVYGINIWGNGKMGGGQPYICSDFSFGESKNSGNYEPAGFTVTNANGYISAMGYSTACDWLFIASECLGNSSLPVGDYTYITVNLNGYRIALLGGRWSRGGDAGGFSWALDCGVGSRGRSIGGRLVYIPTRDSATYTAAIEAWKQKMVA